MPISLKTPIKKEFVLEESDKELGVEDGATTVTIRQARQGDHELRNHLYTKFVQEFDGDKVKVTRDISFDDLRKKEVFLTLCGANIIDEDGKSPLFKFENGRLSSEVEFNIAWGKLEPIMAREIHDKVLDMNPLWNDNINRNKPADQNKPLGE